MRATIQQVNDNLKVDIYDLNRDPMEISQIISAETGCSLIRNDDRTDRNHCTYSISKQGVKLQAEAIHPVLKKLHIDLPS